jgi:hypothetical protein
VWLVVWVDVGVGAYIGVVVAGVEEITLYMYVCVCVGGWVGGCERERERESK